MNPSQTRILIVDDEPNVRQFLRLTLQAEKFTVLEASTAEEALHLVEEATPDLMILDLGLPDFDGQQVIRDVRSKSNIPIVILSGRTEDSEKIAALEHGADDYITKPFAVQNLVSRIHAVFEQQSASRARAGSTIITTGNLQIDLTRPDVKRDSKPVSLDEEEYALLRLLATHGGRVVTMGRIERTLWGKEVKDEGHLQLQKRISSLRHKLESQPAFPKYILTEPSVGYRLEMIPADLSGARKQMAK